MGAITMDTHLAFSLPRAAVLSRILIPKYYDPDLDLAAVRAEERYELPQLGELLLPGDTGSRLGHWIGREAYGTGQIPYVRTSDLSHWRIRSDYKKGVSENIYDEYRDKQDVQVDDILMVAHGTYLVGNVAIITTEDHILVLQDHVFRLRVAPQTGIDPHYLLAALSTKFVRRQIRARQFSADIIDKIGERHLEIRVPILRDAVKRAEIASTVQAIIEDQKTARKRFQLITGSTLGMTRERAEARYAFSVPRHLIYQRVLIPKYYDPAVIDELSEIEHEEGNQWITIGDLVSSGSISVTNGVEVGKMAYGTGSIPFIRTSDIVDHQVRLDVRHGISNELYAAHKHKASVQAGDILVVRDGTYLVGSSAVVTQGDIPAILCGGILRLRSLDQTQVSPYWLLAVLNLPIVRKQMRARQFTRDVIDTLGNRLLEVRIPNPTTPEARNICSETQAIVAIQMGVKSRIQAAINDIEPEPPAVLRGRPSWSMR